MALTAAQLKPVIQKLIADPELLTTLTPEQLAAAKPVLWRGGFLYWKLDSAQRQLRREVEAVQGRARVAEVCSRGWGKTWEGIVKLIETCLRDPNRVVALVTKTKKAAYNSLRLSVEDILEDCPRAVRPEYIKTDGEFRFKNGSVLALLGVDAGRHALLRGRALHGCFVDECQDIDELLDVTRAVLSPAVNRVSGWMVLSGTVPQDSGHEFLTLIREAQGANAFITKTIDECPRYTPEQRERFKIDAGGVDSTTYRREFLCELVFDDTKLAFPEWTVQRAFQGWPENGVLPSVREYTKPEYYDKYVGLDFGFSRDLTVALAGCVDFRNQVLFIEQEWSNRGGQIKDLAQGVNGLMTECWGPKEYRPRNVFMYADGNEGRTIQELALEHGVRFTPTDKHGKKNWISELRTLISEGRLVVHPRCKLLIQTLFAATYDKNHKQYERKKDTGHADAADALLYLARNVRWDRNPHPPGMHWSGNVAYGGSGTMAPPASAAVTALKSVYGKREAAKPPPVGLASTPWGQPKGKRKVGVKGRWGW